MMGTCLQLCHSESSLLQARSVTEFLTSETSQTCLLRETKRQVQILHARTAGALAQVV